MPPINPLTQGITSSLTNPIASWKDPSANFVSPTKIKPIVIQNTSAPTQAGSIMPAPQAIQQPAIPQGYTPEAPATVQPDGSITGAIGNIWQSDMPWYAKVGGTIAAPVVGAMTDKQTDGTRTIAPWTENIPNGPVALGQAIQQGAKGISEQLTPTVVDKNGAKEIARQLIKDNPDITDDEILSYMEDLKANHNYKFSNSLYDNTIGSFPNVAGSIVGAGINAIGTTLGSTISGMGQIASTTQGVSANPQNFGQNIGDREAISQGIAGATNAGMAITNLAFPGAATAFSTDIGQDIMKPIGEASKWGTNKILQGANVLGAGIDPNSQEYKNYQEAGSQLLPMGVTMGAGKLAQKTTPYIAEGINKVGERVGPIASKAGEVVSNVAGKIPKPTGVITAPFKSIVNTTRKYVAKPEEISGIQSAIKPKQRVKNGVVQRSQDAINKEIAVTNSLIRASGTKPIDLATYKTAIKGEMEKIGQEINRLTGQDLSIDISSSTAKLRQLANSDIVQMLDPADTKALLGLADRLDANGGRMKLSIAEEMNQWLNSVLKDTTVPKSEAYKRGLMSLVGDIREGLDTAISNIPGEFKDIKKAYGALRNVYGDTVAREIVFNRQNMGGLVDSIGAIEGAGNIVSGGGKILMGDVRAGVADIGRGIASNAMGRFIKSKNDPNNIIKAVFEQSGKSTSLPNIPNKPKGSVPLLPAPSGKATGAKNFRVNQKKEVRTNPDITTKTFERPNGKVPIPESKKIEIRQKELSDIQMSLAEATRNKKYGETGLDVIVESLGQLYDKKKLTEGEIVKILENIKSELGTIDGNKYFGLNKNDLIDYIDSITGQKSAKKTSEVDDFETLLQEKPKEYIEVDTRTPEQIKLDKQEIAFQKEIEREYGNDGGIYGKDLQIAYNRLRGSENRTGSRKAIDRYDDIEGNARGSKLFQRFTDEVSEMNGRLGTDYSTQEVKTMMDNAYFTSGHKLSVVKEYKPNTKPKKSGAIPAKSNPITNDTKQQVSKSDASDTIPEGYFKNIFGEIIKKPSNEKGGFIRNPYNNSITTSKTNIFDKLKSPDAIANNLKRIGYEIEQTGSNISKSEYITVKKGDESFKIRISDHELPPSYGGIRGSNFADMEIGPHGSITAKGLLERIEGKIGKPEKVKPTQSEKYSVNSSTIKKTEDFLQGIGLKKSDYSKKEDGAYMGGYGSYEIHNPSIEIIEAISKASDAKFISKENKVVDSKNPDIKYIKLNTSDIYKKSVSKKSRNN